MATQEKTLADAFYETLKDVYFAHNNAELCGFLRNHEGLTSIAE